MPQQSIAREVKEETGLVIASHYKGEHCPFSMTLFSVVVTVMNPGSCPLKLFPEESGNRSDFPEE